MEFLSLCQKNMAKRRIVLHNFFRRKSSGYSFLVPKSEYVYVASSIQFMSPAVGLPLPAALHCLCVSALGRFAIRFIFGNG